MEFGQFPHLPTGQDWDNVQLFQSIAQFQSTVHTSFAKAPRPTACLDLPPISKKITAFPLLSIFHLLTKQHRALGEIWLECRASSHLICNLKTHYAFCNYFVFFRECDIFTNCKLKCFHLAECIDNVLFPVAHSYVIFSLQIWHLETYFFYGTFHLFFSSDQEC